ncbi:hypothetical protein HAX54_049234 [Datura stramonium]|uniref:Uncharacterized protein n=1 Tax=Datura stramonium TaxID=4076 RepID=A0ABS8WMC9_DATST|nr:hypothetical protein [Datura stramonium]
MATIRMKQVDHKKDNLLVKTEEVDRQINWVERRIAEIDLEIAESLKAHHEASLLARKDNFEEIGQLLHTFVDVMAPMLCSLWEYYIPLKEEAPNMNLDVSILTTLTNATTLMLSFENEDLQNEIVGKLGICGGFAPCFHAIK